MGFQACNESEIFRASSDTSFGKKVQTIEGKFISRGCKESRGRKYNNLFSVPHSFFLLRQRVPAYETVINPYNVGSIEMLLRNTDTFTVKAKTAGFQPRLLPMLGASQGITQEHLFVCFCTWSGRSSQNTIKALLSLCCTLATSKNEAQAHELSATGTVLIF